MKKNLSILFLILFSFFILSSHEVFAQQKGGKKVQLTFQANYAQVAEGQPVRLSWVAQNGTNILCIAGGGWLGNKTSLSWEDINPKVSLTYTLSCRGEDNTATTTQSVFVAVTKQNPSPIRAFPGAEGFGAYTPGGRGGRVIEVTNLSDSGPGSFRDAVATSGPRIVVFRVSGIIEVCANANPIYITNPFLTIAGQTAPGGGVTLKLSPGCTATNQTALTINTHDVVVRHLRIRSGRSSIYSEGDALTIGGNAYNVVLDHLSLSWATDENLNIARGAHDITLQWSILSEPLFIGSDYGYAALIADDEGFAGTGNITLHHNLFAHAGYRNPQVNIAGVMDVVNNVWYHYSTAGVRMWDIYNKPSRVNVINNYAKAGPQTTAPTREVVTLHSQENVPLSAFVQGNIGPKRPVDTLSHGTSTSCLNRIDKPVSYTTCADDTYLSSVRFTTPSVTTESASSALNSVLSNAGARLPAPDTVDLRVIDNVLNGTGAFISSPTTVGGWPTPAIGTPLPDTDRDGMPNSWEQAVGFNVNVSDGNADADNDGYTNIEEFLNNTNPRLAEALHFPDIAYASGLPQTAQANAAINESVAIKMLITLGTLLITLSLVLLYRMRFSKK